MTKDIAKRADALARDLRAAIEAVAEGDPKAAREAVQRARETLDQAEADVIRAALERSDWRVARAAELLGYPRAQALFKLLEPGRRHGALGKEIERQREKLGFHMGRPPIPEAPTEGRKAPPRRGKSAPRG